mmetsp:Transcript_107495/g.213465  ORF Transcript_107495/g.213465 Transcript_107495/m.213465 type:complete len:347 (+) Transcript_107495:41-1081(+)
MPHGVRARPGSVGVEGHRQNWHDAWHNAFADGADADYGLLPQDRKRGRFVQGLKFRGSTAEVRTPRTEAWSTPPIMTIVPPPAPSLDPNGVGASSSARGRAAIERRVAAGPHSLMARRTFSLFTDGRRQDLGQLEQPSSARGVRRPPLLPGASGVTPTVIAPAVTATAHSSSSASTMSASVHSRSDEILPLTAEHLSSSAQSGGCGNLLTLPLPPFHCCESSSRPTSQSPSQASLSASSHPRSILRQSSSVSNSPRSGSAASTKRVSFAGDCKAPPPTSIAELLTMCRLASDENDQGIVAASRETGHGTRIPKASAAESSGHGLSSAVRRNSVNAREVFRHSLVHF